MALGNKGIKNFSSDIMRLTPIVLLFFTFFTFPVFSQTILGHGKQPQLTVDNKEIVRLVFGEGDNIYFATSRDRGNTFSTPVLIGTVREMHLGMTRGPQLASSSDFSVVTAMDKKGNIHSFRLTHKTGRWTKMKNVNDIAGAAPEGLMSIAADADNTFYAVWLDLRKDHKNNICFSTLTGNSGWSENRFIYTSPESHVCECCKPAIAVNGSHVSVMFRNWLSGSRDLYLISSSNSGRNFSEAEKLGLGTWKLKGCPMDGGGISLDSLNDVHTAWQRERQVFYAAPGQPEIKIGDGRSVGIMGTMIHWENGQDLIIQRLFGKQQVVANGTALKLFEFNNKTVLIVWQQNDQVIFKRLDHVF